MPTREEIEAAARFMCRQDNGCPDLHRGGPGTHSRPDWMKYRRKAEKILIEAEKARKKRPRKCSHPPVLRDRYDGDPHWTCGMCGAEFAEQTTTIPLTDEELKDFKRRAKIGTMTAQEDDAHTPLS